MKKKRIFDKRFTQVRRQANLCWRKSKIDDIIKIKDSRKYGSFRSVSPIDHWKERHQRKRNTKRKDSISKYMSRRTSRNRGQGLNRTVNHKRTSNFHRKQSSFHPERKNMMKQVILSKPLISERSWNKGRSTVSKKTIVDWNVNQLELMKNLENKVKEARESHFGTFHSPVIFQRFKNLTFRREKQM